VRIETAARRLGLERYDWTAVAHDFEDALDRVRGVTRSRQDVA
jgi:hypothetical protein